MEWLVCSAWINWNKVLVVRFRKESMQKSVPIDAADMRTVKKIQIFPHYRVDPHNFGKGMELARETSVLAKKPIKVVNISILYIIRNFYIFQTIFGYEQEAYFCTSKFSCFFHFWTLHGSTWSWSWNFCTHSKSHAFNNDSNNNNKTNTYHNSTLHGHENNKNHVKYFLIFGWSVGKYPHSFGTEAVIEINFAGSLWIVHGSTYYRETFARTVSCVKQQQYLPQRYFIQARLTDERKASEVEYTAYI